MDGNEWVCPICLSSEDKDCYILEPCKHKFHTKCLIESLRKCDSKCPYCRGTDPNKSEISSGEINFENIFLPPGSIRVNRYNTGWEDLNDLNILEEILNDDVLDIDTSLDFDNFEAMDEITISDNTNDISNNIVEPQTDTKV
jgi:hypothetical protein